MKVNVKIALILLIVLSGYSLSNIQAQEKQKKPHWFNDKKGIDLYGLPSVAVDADKGIQYGFLIKPLHYGNPSVSPLYKHLFYAEAAKTTKGNKLLQFKYDSKYLIPNVRVTGIARLETEKSMNFYGFNGYESLYNIDYETEGHEDYISRLYYRMSYRSLRIKVLFQGPLIGDKLSWYAGLAHYNIKAGSLDVNNFENLPDVPTLYDEYVSEGIIPMDQAEGGFSNIIKTGLVADTRDFEPFPTKGFWTEAYLMAAPGFVGNKSSYAGLVITHRQYFPIVRDNLIFAYRLNYQTTFAGNMPWYMMTFKPDTFTLQWEGLGGYKTLRGILRNRVVGEGALLGNFELRWKSPGFAVIGKERYIGIAPFADVARITKKYSRQSNLTGEEDGMHLSYGVGLYLGMDPNFIIHVKYGLAADQRDGISGFYIGIDYLF